MVLVVVEKKVVEEEVEELLLIVLVVVAGLRGKIQTPTFESICGLIMATLAGWKTALRLQPANWLQ